MKLLEIKNLTTEFKTGQGIVKAVRNVNYSLEKGEILVPEKVSECFP